MRHHTQVAFFTQRQRMSYESAGLRFLEPWTEGKCVAVQQENNRIVWQRTVPLVCFQTAVRWQQLEWKIRCCASDAEGSVLDVESSERVRTESVEEVECPGAEQSMEMPEDTTPSAATSNSGRSFWRHPPPASVRELEMERRLAGKDKRPQPWTTNWWNRVRCLQWRALQTNTYHAGHKSKHNSYSVLSTQERHHAVRQWASSLSQAFAIFTVFAFKLQPEKKSFACYSTRFVFTTKLSLCAYSCGGLRAPITAHPTPSTARLFHRECCSDGTGLWP